MSKTKILLIQIAGCLALGTVLGVAFWLFDGGNTVGAPKWIMLSGTCTVFGKCTPAKIYYGKWHKEGYLEVIK